MTCDFILAVKAVLLFDIDLQPIKLITIGIKETVEGVVKRPSIHKNINEL